MAKDYTKLDKDDLLKVIEKLESRKKYGLIWDEEKTKEKFEKESENAFPVLNVVKDKEVKGDPMKPTNILIEGDNYHTLFVLNYTHQEKIDLIYIDPPYNTGKKDFKYNDRWVDKEDTFKHSKWLSFMNKRLRLSKSLLKEEGVLIIHIDEHEKSTLEILLNDIFGEDNFLGTIVWDKRNPKGDARGVATQHEYLYAYARNSNLLLERKKILRPKENAQKILAKAKELFDKLDKFELPEDLRQISKKYKIPIDHFEKFQKLYNIVEINQEFVDWLQNQDYSGGEQAYSNIDKDGEVYQSVSMAWPNKKRAPDEYFIPLIHPKTKKPCPVPARGWRNPPERMKELLDENLIIFGKDEKVQPRRKYFLKENMSENIPSIIPYGGSDDRLLEQMDIQFENPKPIAFCKKIISWFSDEDSLILDFFAGSGSVGHAILDFKPETNRTFILCTNNEENICTEVCYPRIQKAIKGFKTKKGVRVSGLGGNLKYYKTAFVKKSISRDDLKMRITHKCTELLCLRERIFYEVKAKPDYHIFEQYGRVMGVYYAMERDSLGELKKELDKMKGEKILYCFTLDPLGLDKNDFTDWKGVSLEPIPQKILDIYEQIYEY